jgi:transcriptional regulator with XRE-family HTH domain
VSGGERETRTRNVHPEFAQRLAQACEANGSVPAVNYGRLNWFQKQYADRFGVEIATETVRKWFAGETKPRPQALRQLAEILQVDEAWLSLGTTPDSKGKKPVQDATASGVVNLIAGLVQMDGGTIAFPEPDDRRAEAENLHIYGIIRGAQFPLHIVIGEQRDGGNWGFSVPVVAREAVVLGLMRLEPFKFRIVELDSEGLGSVGARKGGSIEVEVDNDLRSGAHAWAEVTTFSKRL